MVTRMASEPETIPPSYNAHASDTETSQHIPGQRLQEATDGAVRNELPARAQDQGDLGVGNLSLVDPKHDTTTANETKEDTNPFRRPHSRSPAPQAHDASIFEDDFELQPDDFDSSHLEVDSVASQSSTPQADPTDNSKRSTPSIAQGDSTIEQDVTPTLATGKGKAPLISDTDTATPSLTPDAQQEPAVRSPRESADGQRNTVYQIKHIRWHDVNKQGIRTSPILTQNINGPCPLLALVNALVLSTPANVETALVETLRAREQVSLGLLLVRDLSSLGLVLTALHRRTCHA